MRKGCKTFPSLDMSPRRSPWSVAPRTFHPPGFCDTPFLCCYMKIDRALDSGITCVSMVEKNSKHQIFLCYKILVLLLISLHNTSNKGQFSKSLNFQLLKKELRTATSKCHSKRTVATGRKVSAIMQFIGFCFLYVAYVKICALTTSTVLVHSVSS